MKISRFFFEIFREMFFEYFRMVNISNLDFVFVAACYLL